MGIVSIKKVFSIIDSCINHTQLKTCEKLVDVYTELVKEKGVVNFELVRKTLNIKIKEKELELEYIESNC